MALGSTQPLTGMSTKRPVRRADNLTDCHEIWEPRPLDPSGPVEDCTGITLPYLQSDISISGKPAISVFRGGCHDYTVWTRTPEALVTNY